MQSTYAESWGCLHLVGSLNRKHHSGLLLAQHIFQKTGAVVRSCDGSCWNLFGVILNLMTMWALWRIWWKKYMLSFVVCILLCVVGCTLLLSSVKSFTYDLHLVYHILFSVMFELWSEFNFLCTSLPAYLWPIRVPSLKNELMFHQTKGSPLIYLRLGWLC